MEVLLFGVTREIVGAECLSIPSEAAVTNVAELRAWLAGCYPQFDGLSSLAIAVDQEYADDDQTLSGDEEIALIPPVSGG